ncbi:spore cortex biosynthesis protein YabQ [Paenibacillus doosanensis]|uniref:Spore protein YabQ n=1 Tax=Paenibacillus konkukensis TaxID=2020716 RepID=A0ABY4RSI8_9BACL|nr:MULTISPECIES: spore cortex biosynthesis protein YabQ [Paenibacillus]MCS7463195.1 spore cortex biosynthesis protein YabQ [Paenibacillus doosanensis]UQZ84917.1 Spore protein YabQ [Paenibacillus konkukensis]
MTLQVQFVTMGMMLLGGLSLGGLFDLYRVLAGQLRAPRYAYYLLDIFFWCVGTLLVFKLLYMSNLGQVRMFIFIGLFIGVGVYFLLFSRTVIGIIKWMIRAVHATIRVGKTTIRLFIVIPAIWIYRTTVVFLGFLLAIAMFLYKVVLQLLYPIWRLLLWLLRPLIRWIRLPIWVKKTAQWTAAWFRRFF